LKLASLILIEVAAFLLIIGESYAFFGFVILFGPIPHNFGDYTVDAVARVILTAGLGLLWVLVMLGLTRVYVRSKLRSPTPKPSS
jgi:uncharacterized membrane protein